MPLPFSDKSRMKIKVMFDSRKQRKWKIKDRKQERFWVERVFGWKDFGGEKNDEIQLFSS